MVAARPFRYVTLHRNVHRITLITLHPMMYVASPRISQATSTSSSISACIHLPLQSKSEPSTHHVTWNLLNAWFAVQDLESLQKVQKWLLNSYQFPRPQRVLQVCPTYPYLAKQSGGSFRLDQWSRNCWARIWNAFLSATSAASIKTYGGQWKSGRTGGLSERTGSSNLTNQSQPSAFAAPLRIFSIWVRAWSRKSWNRANVGNAETYWDVKLLKLLKS